jgi:uncharacterized protein YcbX
VARCEGGFLLECRELPPVALPERIDGGEPLSVTVWNSTVAALAHRGASEWFSRLLGRECRAVYMPDSSKRQLKRGPGLVSFADGYPLLLISEASLAELNRRCPEPMVMERFRPNVVVSGDPPHFEDELRQFSLGEVAFTAPKLCDRCVVTTRDPVTGVRGKEPLKTLANYRRWDGAVWFGTNLLPSGHGWLGIGDPLTVRSPPTQKRPRP